MYRDVFISDFSTLGGKISAFLNKAEENAVLTEAIARAFDSNNLFTPYMQERSLSAICDQFLDYGKLESWTFDYVSLIHESEREVLVVMAGNLPLVGFHDLLSVLASGKKAVVKLSSMDNVLLPALTKLLSQINRYWDSRISYIVGLPKHAGIVIATGNDSTAAFFGQSYPSAKKLIRGAKSSVAVLTGGENREDVSCLASDMFLYFGMGCRSVSTLLVPDWYDTTWLVKELGTFSSITEGSASYRNSYKYQKALSLMKGDNFLDGGFFLLKHESAFPPPMGVVGVVPYSAKMGPGDVLEELDQSIQCVVNYPYKGEYIGLGESQQPRLDDYADGVNSLAFLLKNS